MRLSKPTITAVLLGVALYASWPGQAQTTTATVGAGPSAAELFKDADIPLGEKLIAEHKCTECHVRRVGGDGSAIYRPTGRINTPGALRGMVDYCSTELNLGLFPEDVTAVAAVLQRDHYRFGLPRPAAAPARR